MLQKLRQLTASFWYKSIQMHNQNEIVYKAIEVRHTRDLADAVKMVETRLRFQHLVSFKPQPICSSIDCPF